MLFLKPLSLNLKFARPGYDVRSQLIQPPSYLVRYPLYNYIYMMLGTCKTENENNYLLPSFNLRYSPNVIKYLGYSESLIVENSTWKLIIPVLGTLFSHSWGAWILIGTL